MSVFNPTREGSHTEAKAFIDPHGGVDIQRYDTMKYRKFDQLTEKQLGFFWQPQEIDITRDSKDFRDLSPHEKHIFTSNLKRQIILDSVQGRSPNLAFLPLVSIPELETWIETWSFSEIIHSRSYTHIIRNVYSNPSKVFDEVYDIKEIMDCARDISKNYDDLIEHSKWYSLLGTGKFTVSGDGKDRKINISEYDLKKKLWLTIMSVNILEGIRFYVSFACSWAFAELKKMEGNAKIIKLICRDENLHLASTQYLLKILPKDDPDFKKIQDDPEIEVECIRMFEDAVSQEKSWADYLFKDGSIIGLNDKLLHDYIEWIANKRMLAVGLPTSYKAPQANPLPWTQSWIGGSDVQVAPQESEISSYTSGGTKHDVDGNTFKGFKL